MLITRKRFSIKLSKELKINKDQIIGMGDALMIEYVIISWITNSF